MGFRLRKMTQKRGISPGNVFCGSSNVLPGHNGRYAVFLSWGNFISGSLKCEPRVFKMSHYVKKKGRNNLSSGGCFSRESPLENSTEVATHGIHDVSA